MGTGSWGRKTFRCIDSQTEDQTCSSFLWFVNDNAAITFLWRTGGLGVGGEKLFVASILTERPNEFSFCLLYCVGVWYRDCHHVLREIHKVRGVVDVLSKRRVLLLQTFAFVVLRRVLLQQSPNVRVNEPTVLFATEIQRNVDGFGHDALFFECYNTEMFKLTRIMEEVYKTTTSLEW